MAGGSIVTSSETRQLFSVGPVVYTVRDVIDAAHVRGEIEPIFVDLQRMAAIEQRAINEDREPDETAVDTAAQTFRYDHDLITAEETERWLAERHLTLDDFGDYFSRNYWGNAGEQIDLAPTLFLSASAEERELLTAELTLSGESDRMATRLAWRVAAATGAEMPPAEEVEARQREFFERFELTEETLGAWLEQLGRDLDWFEEQVRNETIFALEKERILTAQSRQRELSSLRLQLTAFELETIEFDSHDAACEALLCVREDGMSMEEVATEGRYPYFEEKPLMEDIPDDIQQLFLSVTVGEILEPMERNGSFRLCRVAGKTEPDTNDPAVQQRVDKRILQRHFADLMGRHVRWENMLDQS